MRPRCVLCVCVCVRLRVRVWPARAFVIYDVELLNVTRAEEVIDMA